MTNIIIVLPKLENAKMIKNILARNGFKAAGLCTTGAQAISYADGLHEGIIVCSYKLADMVYSELKLCMPEGFEMLLLASAKFLDECYGNDIVCLAMPLNTDDFINTISMMAENIERKRRKRRAQPRVRSEAQERDIKEAKEVLMERNHMTEEEAHRYLQKASMESGTGMAESARMVLLMMS